MPGRSRDLPRPGVFRHVHPIDRSRHGACRRMRCPPCNSEAHSRRRVHARRRTHARRAGGCESRGSARRHLHPSQKASSTISRPLSANEEQAARIRSGQSVNLPELSRARQVKVFQGQRDSDRHRDPHRRNTVPSRNRFPLARAANSSGKVRRKQRCCAGS